MMQQALPPFFQLGHRVVLRVWAGTHVDEVCGEVVDTEDGWLAIRAEAAACAAWYNLRFIISITMQEAA